MLSAGDQDPIIPLMEVVGNGANVPPTQIDGTAAKVGETIGLTVTASVCVVAH